MNRFRCLPRQSLKTSRGLSLIELMASVTILAVLASIAAPSYAAWIERQRSLSVAQALADDLRWARTEAIKRQASVHVLFKPGSSWAYDVVTGSAPRYQILKTTTASAFPGTTLQFARFPGQTPRTTFEPVLGRATTGSVQFAAGDHRVDVKVSLLGRVRTCSASTGGSC